MSRYNKIMALAHEISPSSPAVLVDMHNKILDDAAHICEKSRDAIAKALDNAERAAQGTSYWSDPAGSVALGHNIDVLRALSGTLLPGDRGRLGYLTPSDVISAMAWAAPGFQTREYLK